MFRASPGLIAMVAAVVAIGYARAQSPAPTPPMGWSEWDSYGLTVMEADFRANAAVLGGMRQYGWRYAMLDAGWYMQQPAGAVNKDYVWDANGRLLPAANRFPSAANGEGFRPLAEWLHARGLKLGIHVMLGIPRQSVAANLPIAGSPFHASDAADTAQTCSWDKEFYVVRDNAAGQAWYDSIASQYARWGVDLIKLGCVADHPFHETEIRQVSNAIRKTGRSMVLSLSPGPPPMEEVGFVAAISQMWRVSPEHWDLWNTPPGRSFPVGLLQEFDLLAQWSPWVKPGHWVDADALADGWLSPSPAWGKPRHSQLTENEERSEFALWCFARAPLVEGANLTRLGRLTRELMKDRELIDIDQHARDSHPIIKLPAGFDHVRVWVARIAAPGHAPRSYVAFFNLDDRQVTLDFSWAQLGLGPGHHSTRNLWDGSKRPASDRARMELPAHGSAICLIDWFFSGSPPA